MNSRTATAAAETSEGRSTGPSHGEEATDRVVLRVKDLQVRTSRRGREGNLVSQASLEVKAGGLHCLVGESGSGKSVTAHAIAGLIQLSKEITVGGSVVFDGEELVGKSDRYMRKLRGRRIAMIFQDPMSSLDPVMRISEQMVESLRRRHRMSKTEERARLVELLEQVGIRDPERCLRQYPHQLSGGMSQRVMIAMALAGEPEILIADEPTTALDVTIQAEILSLLNRLRQETGMALLLITHDMTIAEHLADEVSVMYAGRVVEQGTPSQLFAEPAHPYTFGLQASIPSVDVDTEEDLAAIPGSVPDPWALPTGCSFHPRCPLATEQCEAELPPLTPLGSDRAAACWRTDEVLRNGVTFPTRVRDQEVSEAR